MASATVVRQPRPVFEVIVTDEWASGICDCCEDMTECCFAFWCFSCYTCKIAKAYGQCLCLPLLEIFGCIIHPITMSMRVSMRQRFSIKGTMCKDCVYSTFCLPCVWCQMDREMEYRTLPVVLGDIIQRT